MFEFIETLNKRTLLYGSTLAIATGGLLYFRKSFSLKRVKLPFINNNTNTMDLITSEIPLTLSTFAGIESLHYAFEMIHNYKYLNIKPTQKMYITLGICSCLGFIYPLYHIFRNRSELMKKNQNNKLLRNGFKEFCIHFGGITLLITCSIVGIRILLF
eukprot:268997_1